MHRFVLAPALLCLAACSPTFNWREVRGEASPLRAVLPCKPDQESRTVPLAGRQVELRALGCDAGGATYAVLSGDIADPLRAGEVLAQWKAATLANFRSAASRDAAFLPAGAMSLPQSLRVAATGQRADGSRVESEAAYFARGSRVYQAMVFAARLGPETVDPFFQGLRFE